MKLLDTIIQRLGDNRTDFILLITEDYIKEILPGHIIIGTTGVLNEY